MQELEKKKEYQKQHFLEIHGINVGHLTHLEKGARHPSHKALKSIAKSLGVPYQPLFHSYDKELDNKQIEYHYTNYLTYNKIPAISDIDSYVDCPANFSNASFAYRSPDDTMAPIIRQNSYVFVEINGLIKHKEIGLFKVNDDILIRKLFYKKNHFVLKANDRSKKDIIISTSDDFQIIGKIYI